MHAQLDDSRNIPNKREGKGTYRQNNDIEKFTPDEELLPGDALIVYARNAAEHAMNT